MTFSIKLNHTYFFVCSKNSSFIIKYRCYSDYFKKSFCKDSQPNTLTMKELVIRFVNFISLCFFIANACKEFSKFYYFKEDQPHLQLKILNYWTISMPTLTMSNQ